MGATPNAMPGEAGFQTEGFRALGHGIENRLTIVQRVSEFIEPLETQKIPGRQGMEIELADAVAFFHEDVGGIAEVDQPQAVFGCHGGGDFGIAAEARRQADSPLSLGFHVVKEGAVVPVQPFLLFLLDDLLAAEECQ